MAFGIGLVLGGMLGCLTMALMVSARWRDEEDGDE